MMQHWRKALAALLLAALAPLAFSYAVRYPPVPGRMVETAPHPAFEQRDHDVAALFDDATGAAEGDDEQRYRALFRYFLAGYLAYRNDSGAYAHYPGAPSSHGRDIDGLEGFSRSAPLMAAWLHGRRPAQLEVAGFGQVDLRELLRDAIAAGTDPQGPDYWGDIRRSDQRVVEAADIALALWLAGDALWQSFSEVERNNILGWLAQAEGKTSEVQIANWQLFPMLVDRVLASFGGPVSEEEFAAEWDYVKNSYAGDGWFRDKAHGGIDYYNAWSIHYALYWLNRIDPDFAPDFVRRTRREFVQFYQYMLTPAGLPIFGRSICYRTAAPAPLIIASETDPDLISPGQARHALNSVWRYFLNHQAVADGALTQGYCAADMRLLDEYSGPASCLWGLRSLVLALTHPPQSRFWTAAAEPLPVERADFRITSEAARLRVVGHQEDASVVVQQLDATATNTALRPYTWRHRVAEWLFRRPFRPSNRRAKYAAPEYSSNPPFCACPSEEPRG